jgi:magnesium-transporting ATPase (P-type)
MINYSKNKKIISSFFIFIYVLFIIIFTLHYHIYDFDEKTEVKDYQQENTALVLDFLSDGLSICAINHFSHSILNYSSTSEELNIFLNKAYISCLKTNSFCIKTDLLNNISPRASPVSI